METISNIFAGLKESKKENTIKTVIVDPKKHGIGIKNLLNNEIGKEFVFDSENTRSINNLFSYFTGNEKICTENEISLNKGIFLVGTKGTGKSILMKTFKKYTGEINHVNSFQWFDSAQIIDSANLFGISILKQFDIYEGRSITCYIDDICSQNEKVKNFGTDISVIEQLINLRYNLFQRYGKLTHFSSNIYPEQMDKFYESRIIDRLKEMCNFVELTGKSRRQ